MAIKCGEITSRDATFRSRSVRLPTRVNIKSFWSELCIYAIFHLLVLKRWLFFDVR